MKIKIIIIALLLAGFGLLFYPFISNAIFEMNGSRAIQQYSEAVSRTDPAQLAAQREKAVVYNQSLTGQNIRDPFIPDSGMVYPDNYSEILDFAGHMMGYVAIPKIQVDLPIFHGTSDEVLAKGVGHMSQTAFPIGGAGNHTVLTGHTGYAKARLFTDLNKLQVGDLFYIHILGDTLAYQVDQVKVVLPQDTQDLVPVPGKDYVTLVTCTPYGINSHRLLVRGTRVPYVPTSEGEPADGAGWVPVDGRVFLLGAGMAALIILVLILRKRV